MLDADRDDAGIGVGDGVHGGVDDDPAGGEAVVDVAAVAGVTETGTL